MARTSKYRTSDTALPAREEEWRAGLYIRLSREDGDKIESESVASQRALLEQFIKAHSDLSIYDVYTDDGWSGTDFDRPSFQRMIADITAKKINCVVVKDLSRFGRNYVEAGKYLETVFPLFNVRFIAVNDQIDSASNPASASGVIVPFKNIINDEYCRDISVKVRSALDIRRKQGKFIGSFAAYGYEKDERDHNRLVIDEEAAYYVRLIFRKFLEGYSILGIARALNEAGVPNPSAYRAQRGLSRNDKGDLWVDSTVRRILTNEVYIGNLVQKKNEVVSYKVHVAKAVDAKRRISVQNTHEPIILREDFDKAQSLLKRDTRTSPDTGRLSVMAGFLKCADCGRAMVKRTVKQPYKTYEYYCCSTYRKMHGACTKHAVRAEKLEKAVLDALNGYIRLAVDFEEMTKKFDKAKRGGAESKRLTAELAKSERETEKAKKILLDLYPDYKSGIVTREQYFALKEKYENVLARARETEERIRKQIEEFDGGVDGSNEFIATFKKYDGLKELTREIMCELADNVYVREGGEIEIRLKCRDSYLTARDYFMQNGRFGEERSPTADLS